MVKPDLMKSRYTLLTDAKSFVKENSGININCRLKIKLVDKSIDSKFFSRMDDLQEIIGNN